MGQCIQEWTKQILWKADHITSNILKTVLKGSPFVNTLIQNFLDTVYILCTVYLHTLRRNSSKKNLKC